ncbi:hypothetical protein CRUP_013559 [Coryphaenoides rupestris]|nr:hypothetical protein CRUP_013559 [Coryphaenoides rupestris]
MTSGSLLVLRAGVAKRRGVAREKVSRMDHICVGYLKSLITFLNFLCWVCAAFVVGFGEFQMMNSRFESLVTGFWPIYPANTLVVTGTIACCFFLLLFTLMLVELAMGIVFLVYHTKIDSFIETDLMGSLETFKCCGVHGEADWQGNTPASCCSQDECDSAPFNSWSEGCLLKLRNWFSHNFRSTGAGVVALFIIQFGCMCFTIPLFCHFRRSGLGYF